jgi:hypothetical protein
MKAVDIIACVVYILAVCALLLDMIVWSPK